MTIIERQSVDSRENLNVASLESEMQGQLVGFLPPGSTALEILDTSIRRRSIHHYTEAGVRKFPQYIISSNISWLDTEGSMQADIVRFTFSDQAAPFSEDAMEQLKRVAMDDEIGVAIGKQACGHIVSEVYDFRLASEVSRA